MEVKRKRKGFSDGNRGEDMYLYVCMYMCIWSRVSSLLQTLSVIGFSNLKTRLRTLRLWVSGNSVIKNICRISAVMVWRWMR